MEKIIFTFRFLADGRHVAALSNSDVLRCLVGLHMAGPPWVPRDLKTHALNTHRGRFEIERAIKSLKGILETHMFLFCGSSSFTGTYHLTE